MSRSIRKAMAKGVAVAALTPLLVTGCSGSGNLSSVEQGLSSVPGVADAYVWSTTDGAPWNRGLSVRLYVDEDPGDGLQQLIDDAFRVAWQTAPYEPTAGITLRVALEEKPEHPEESQNRTSRNTLDLQDAFRAIPWSGDYLGVASMGRAASVSTRQLEERYGEWPGDA